MSKHGGREQLSIPGPSVMPEAVLRAMHRASPNIYEGELINMMDGITAGLKRVARTKQGVAIYIGNGHGAWEAALSNVVGEGDHVLGLFNGRFGEGWAEMATGLGAVVEKLDFGKKAPVDASKLEAALKADTQGRIKAVLCTHTDTSTSIRNDIEMIRAAMTASGHDALLMVDCIASLGCDRFEMDAWGVDVAVAASQKGLMVPAGVSFVFISDKAAARRAEMKRVSRYWDWAPRANPEMFFQYFGGTAPTHHLYGLRTALGMLEEEGMEAVWARHEKLANAVWAACEAWGADGPLKMNVASPAQRSCAVTALHVGQPHGLNLRRWCEQNAGVTLGIGLGMSTDEDPKGEGFFRIGHMGHVNPQMIMATLGSMETAFEAHKVPRGAGALDAAVKVLASSGA
ncbi:aminotransferase class V-fold PLP-dependent enzyme [Lentibacter algarum]|uniref:pyridoxal-phosphate-dependent aminotransferase family protein n=1 Tax=Lentibacter algarum TaxID=576131 RepID=UPI001C06AAC2|nr:aminotransferase class V-fold PLP-dependent enzyme [Lentibacter algarum]MBU2981970.1 aminotransferase class V-fold PLP-dependent enzyme [Lentibacter algarum]